MSAERVPPSADTPPEPVFVRTRIEPVRCIENAIKVSTRNYWHLFGVTAVGTLIASFGPVYILLAPMLAGIYMSILRELRGEAPKFEVLFHGFHHFAATLAPWGLRLGIVAVVVVPLYAAFIAVAVGTATLSGDGDGERAFVLMILLVELVAIALVFLASLATVLFQFAELLIVDFGLDGWAASKLSARAVWANRWGMLGLILLHGLLSFLGTLACCVGVFFVLPATFTSTVLAFQKVFPASVRQLPPGQLPPPLKPIG